MEEEVVEKEDGEDEEELPKRAVTRGLLGTVLTPGDGVDTEEPVEENVGKDEVEDDDEDAENVEGVAGKGAPPPLPTPKLFCNCCML